MEPLQHRPAEGVLGGTESRPLQKGEHPQRGPPPHRCRNRRDAGGLREGRTAPRTARRLQPPKGRAGAGHLLRLARVASWAEGSQAGPPNGGLCEPIWKTKDSV
eukprot:339077-Pyramimonas_sp.AAC.1